MTKTERRVFRAYTGRHLADLLARAELGPVEQREYLAVAEVYPFRVNNYVVDELIDWGAVPDDPLFQLTFPQPGMLAVGHRRRVTELLARDAAEAELRRVVGEIRRELQPHPAGQMTLNATFLGGERLPGLQHKYAETVLVFPRQGQTCHTYCAYCFRWPQFVGRSEWRIATDSPDRLHAYLRAHKEVTSVLITGGDPLVMSTQVLARYVEPLLDPEFEHIESVRIGTKALTYWPYRVLTDPDAGDLLRLLERVARAGRQAAVMAHVSHGRELLPEPARRAFRAIADAGAMVRCQAPIIRHVNDDADVLADMWRDQVRLSAVPYYMFVERDTGPHDYFAVPLALAYELFSAAYRQVSGLARTVRGPVMSATPGKVCVDGVAEVTGEKVFVLRMLQARDPALVNRPFFARYDESATWLSDLVPAFSRGFPFDATSDNPPSAAESSRSAIRQSRAPMAAAAVQVRPECRRG